MTKNFTWKDVLSKEKKKPYFIKTLQAVFNDRAAGITVYPAENDVFNAFRLTELSNLKVVILGQDPYHGPNQAHGLAFSVLPNTPIPPSLLNIYKEIKQDIPNFVFPKHGYLKYWAKQGILLLNTVLTVIAGKPNSHAHLGWEEFTNQVIITISQCCKHVVFLLWGASAQRKSSMINTQSHFILKAAHPSPLSAHRGFFGCKHFSRTNTILHQFHQKQIDWNPIL